MILDAGHIGVNSSLADKAEIKDMQAKKGQALSDDEFHKLEGLMYDEFSLKLESTQVRDLDRSSIPGAHCTDLAYYSSS